MAKFQGKWEDDLSVPRSNFDELMEKIGNQEKSEEYKNAKSYLIYDIKGDNWTMKQGADAFPGQEKVYTFTVGKEFSGVMLDGSNFKSVIKIDSDSQITEVIDNEKWGTFTLVKKIEGDIMKVVETVAGATTTFQMKRA